MYKLEKFTKDIENVLKDNLVSIIAFGSQANVECRTNNINLMIVINEINSEILVSISKFVKKWIKSKNPTPVIMCKSEWFSSFDVYAMEFSDIIDNYNIVYGENLVKTINIAKSDLRYECEYELKRLLLKYENEYIMNYKSNKYMKQVLDKVIKTLIVVFRSVLRIYDNNVPYRASDIINAAAKYLNFDAALLQKMSKVKYENDKYSKQELLNTEKNIINELQKLLTQVSDIKVY